jgi:cell division protein FtsA
VVIRGGLMAKEIFYTAIDLGTTKVCTVITKVGPEGELKVIGTGITPSQGMNKGLVENIAEVQEVVRASASDAQKYLGRGVSWTYLGITGNHISCINTTGSLNGSGENGSISSHDVQNLIKTSYPDIHDDKEVLHIIPMNYVVDGLTGVRNPVGLHAGRVQVESHVVMGEAPVLKNLVKVVEGCNLSVRSLVFQPLASAEATLTEDEREVGVVLADIGGGTTDVVVFRAGSPLFTSVIPVGGNQITRDLSIALRIPMYLAEEVKVRWGHAIPEQIPADEEVHLPGFEGQARRMVKRRAMCQPIQERLAETLKLVLMKVRQAGLRQLPPGGLVITGGTSEMPGLQEMAAKAIGVPVRIGCPRDIPGLPAYLRKPAFSTSIGILLWGIKHQGEKREYTNGERTLWGSKAHIRRFNKRKGEEKVSV